MGYFIKNRDVPKNILKEKKRKKKNIVRHRKVIPELVKDMRKLVNSTVRNLNIGTWRQLRLSAFSPPNLTVTHVYGTVTTL